MIITFSTFGSTVADLADVTALVDFVTNSVVVEVSVVLGRTVVVDTLAAADLVLATVGATLVITFWVVDDDNTAFVVVVVLVDEA